MLVLLIVACNAGVGNLIIDVEGDGFVMMMMKDGGLKIMMNDGGYSCTKEN